MVDGRDPELVARTVFQSRQCELPVHELVIAAHPHKAIAADHAGLQDILSDFGTAIILGGPPGHGDRVFGDSSDDEILWALRDGWERDRSNVRDFHPGLNVNHRRTEKRDFLNEKKNLNWNKIPDNF